MTNFYTFLIFSYQKCVSEFDQKKVNKLGSLRRILHEGGHTVKFQGIRIIAFVLITIRVTISLRFIWLLGESSAVHRRNSEGVSGPGHRSAGETGC